jgi:hypothetical protein
MRFRFRSEPALFGLSIFRRLRKSLIVLMQFWVPNVYDMVLFLVGPFGLLCGQF